MGVIESPRWKSCLAPWIGPAGTTNRDQKEGHIGSIRSSTTWGHPMPHLLKLRRKLAATFAVVVTAVFAIPALAMPSTASAWEYWCYPASNQNACPKNAPEFEEFNEVNGPTGWLWYNAGDNESGEGLKSYLWHYASNIGKWQVVAYGGSSVGKGVAAFTEGSYSWRSHGQVTKWYEYKYHLYGFEAQCNGYYYEAGYCPGIDIGGE